MDEIAARSTIADHLGVPLSAVEDEATLDGLGADPLDVIALVLRLEKSFAIRISDEQADGCRTVGDVVAALRLALVAGARPVFVRASLARRA